MNEAQLSEVLKPVIDKFVGKLDGRFSQHVSDEFIKAFITREFLLLYSKNASELATTIAYQATSGLFVTLLERGCECHCNGHHVAQSFCSYFKDEPFSVNGVMEAALI
ncbi:MAG TPA: hypothetical protein VEA58_03170 [Anaerovoracaceae bacterium]|nr:hypothetical protein [Anaerovoracaceae bacterium]